MTTPAARRRRAILWGTVGAVAGSLLVLLAVVIVYAGNKATDAADNTDSATELAETVKDCVEPGGKCFAQARRQRLQVSEETRRIAIYTAVCSRYISSADSDARAAEVVGRCVDRLKKAEALP